MTESSSSAKSLDKLIGLLDLERIDVNLFRGRSPKDRWQRVFGGQVIGQALVAASRTVEERICHSLHAYFLRPGDPKTPILYSVVRSRDGRSFSARRVVATQHGKEIFHMLASFQVEEQGVQHQFDMPDVPPPDDLPNENQLRQKIIEHVPEDWRASFLWNKPIEVRPINQPDMLNPEPMHQPHYSWMRAVEPLPQDYNIHLCVLAYASDMSLLDTAMSPHALSWFKGEVISASLDHAMWFHHSFRADEWLLYKQDSPSASGARGFNRGMIFNREGLLVASVAQEGLMRVASKKKG